MTRLHLCYTMLYWDMCETFKYISLVKQVCIKCAYYMFCGEGIYYKLSNVLPYRFAFVNTFKVIIHSCI